MTDKTQTKEELVDEVTALRERIAELESRENQQKVQALEKENRNFRMLLDQLPDVIYIKDVDSRFLYANQSVTNMVGKSDPSELIGKTDYDFFPDDIAERYFRDEQEFLQSGEIIRTLEQPSLDTKTKREGWILTSKIRYENDSGELIGLMGIGRNVTELKDAQAELQKQVEIINAQREVLQELSTPIIPIMDNIIIMPLIGAVDTSRSRDIMRSLLAGITEHRARIVILDITGVPLVDTGVADHLNRTIQAARLKGAQTIVTGISDAVAETIVDLGIDWTSIETLRDLQTGLKVAMQQLKTESA